jgi:thiaminase/transcriptional activator TenA
MVLLKTLMTGNGRDRAMGFCAEQLKRVRPIWDRILSHRFLIETRDGTIKDDVFAIWMRQDYLFVEAAIPFIAVLIPKAQPNHVEPLTQTIAALHKELELFRDRAGVAGVDLTDTQPSFTNHAYIQFLLASAYRESYPCAYTVLYTAEKAYYDSWTVVKQGLDPGSVWYPFVENWAGQAFADYVTFLQTNLDDMAEQAGAAELQRMAELFELTAKYELAFWEMAALGEGWPGM